VVILACVGFSSKVRADMLTPPAGSSFYINDFITDFIELETYYYPTWDRYTIINDGGNELFIAGTFEFWNGTSWDFMGNHSAGAYSTEYQDPYYYYRTDVSFYLAIPKSDLLSSGIGYYRYRFYAGSDGYGDDTDPYFIIYYDGDTVMRLEDASIEASVWGIDPESAIEITDLDELLTIGYSGLDDYEDLYLTFTHPSGISSNSKEYDIDIIGGSGSIEVNLADFDIDKNGNWYLQAVASREGYQVQDDLFLSGYGWIWSGNLTSGEYYLDINIEGFEDIFVMGDFNTWYDENSKFDEPTAMFSSIVGFFEPIFGTIGEFGNRIEDYFDKNTAYTKGAEIGKAIPLFGYYLEQVNVFMGSFPLMNWLLVIILILVGIFIFKVIMKFIPFLGG
jgi:multisubunit Na+/H+ antiporter MnhG subunit